MQNGNHAATELNTKISTNIPGALKTAIFYDCPQALGVAAGILRKGTQSLSRVSSHGEREFHRALLAMRQRWRLRRVPNGAIQGDISYHSGEKAMTIY